MHAAVVTGAAMGIGRAVAERLIADGIHVVALDLSTEALAEARAELGDLFEPVVGDVGDWDAHERAADGLLRAYIRLYERDAPGRTRTSDTRFRKPGGFVLNPGIRGGSRLPVRLPTMREAFGRP
jgi:NAD(P)-dependent dehydrogenase (short-subunit alcohol dehydrogenase family)